MASQLGSVLLGEDDLDGALRYAEHAWKIDEKLYEPDHPTTTRAAAKLKALKEQKGIR
jgi:hypothetical protein